MDDEPMRTLCPACECWVDDYAPGCAVLYEGQKYHPQCVPVHLCECGCGKPTTIQKFSFGNNPKRAKKGEYNRFALGHCTHRPTPSAESRFWSRVVKTDSCWEWTAASSPFGYGHIHVRKGYYISSHRFSWELHNGPIPPGLHVLHKCDNPPCVNPAHLFLGTPKDNADDKERKGRGPVAARAAMRAKTHCKHGHEYTPENTYYAKDKSRCCRACQNAGALRYRREKALSEGRPCPGLARTHCKRGHELTPENTSYWQGARRCRKCQNMRDRARHAALKKTACHEAETGETEDERHDLFRQRLKRSVSPIGGDSSAA